MRAANGVVRRIVVLFSCGAASAVAGKLVLQSANGLPVKFLNNHVVEEHPDNARFLRDCENWYGQPIEIVKNEKYNGSIYEVFNQVKYIKNRWGAACTKRLKRDVRDEKFEFGDRVVLGFTSEETDRLERFIDQNEQLDVWAPLIDFQLSKADCLAMLAKAGIEIPEMYKLGYHNNNCIGCVKAGIGYWNKIRVDFPETFARMAELEQRFGPGSFLFKPIRSGAPRRSLRDIAPDEGRMQDEPDITCGPICEIVTDGEEWVRK